jgi:hypothetical protein
MMTRYKFVQHSGFPFPLDQANAEPTLYEDGVIGIAAQVAGIERGKKIERELIECRLERRTQVPGRCTSPCRTRASIVIRN